MASASATASTLRATIAGKQHRRRRPACAVRPSARGAGAQRVGKARRARASRARRRVPPAYPRGRAQMPPARRASRRKAPRRNRDGRCGLRCRPTGAAIPRPVTWRASSTVGRGEVPAAATSARASGCSDRASRAAASRDDLSSASATVRRDRSQAQVPFGQRAGLVEYDVVTLASVSSASLRASTTPRRASEPAAAASAAGVASASAQGHETAEHREGDRQRTRGIDEHPDECRHGRQHEQRGDEIRATRSALRATVGRVAAARSLRRRIRREAGVLAGRLHAQHQRVVAS